MKISLKNLCYIVTLVTQLSIGQTNVDLRPQVKSPEVAKFEQYMNMPVNLVSGTPQVSIPIYTLEYGGMTLPITLEYDASGVKVESIASSVGQNWSLNVGGAVSRIVKGAPDEGNPFSYPMSNYTKDGYYKDYGLSNLDNQIDSTSETGYPINKAGAWNLFLTDLSYGNKDSQPDLFSFNTPQGGSKFVFNDQRQVVYLENTDFIIKEDFVSNYFRSWTATSPKGIKYKFGTSTGLWNGNSNYVERTGVRGVGELTLNNMQTNCWFLSEISNYTNDKKIEISYLENTYEQVLNHTPSVLGSYYSCLSEMVQNNCQISDEQMYHYLAINPTGFGDTGGNSSGAFEYLTNSLQIQNRTESKVISKIKAGNTIVNFVYNDREDLLPDPYNSSNKAKKLVEVNIYENETCIKKFIFTYNTTTSTDPSSRNCVTLDTRKRFYLTELKEQNCDGSIVKPYAFVYNTTPLPNRLSYAQDNWGFYNGKINNVSLFGKYKYFQNLDYLADRNVDFSFSKAGSLEKIIYPTKGSVSFEFEPHQSEEVTDYFYDMMNPVSYIVNDFQPQSQGSFTNPSATTTFQYNLPSNQILMLNSNLRFPSYQFSTPPYYCTVSNMNAVEIFNNSGQLIFAISYSELQHTTPETAITKLIKKPLDPSLFVQGQTYTLKVYGITNCYHNNTSITSHLIIPTYDVGGLRLKKVTHRNHNNDLIKEMNYTYFNPKIASNPKKSFRMYFNYYNMYDPLVGLASYSNRNYLKSEATNSTHAGFRMGYYNFISSGVDPFNLNFVGPHISYGKVVETDGNGKTEHNFNPYKSYLDLCYGESVLYPATPKNQSILAGEKMSIIAWDNSNVDLNTERYEYNYSTSNTTVKGILATKLQAYSIIPFTVYSIQGQIKTLKKETKTTNFNNNLVETIKEYEYNGNAHNQPTKITTSDSMGNSNITTLYYPSDLLAEPFMTDLVAQNRKDTPIRTENYKNTTKIFEQKTTYAKDASTNNFLLPKNVYAAKFPNVLPLIANVGNLEKKVTSDLYDSQGNLTQFTQESGVPVSIIWGYNQTQPVAKLENIAYGSIPASLITNIQSVSNLPTSTEAQVVAALNALRTSTDANLQKALITTYTYKPLIGVSTITDPKGDTMTYEYDTFGRLSTVKDKTGNKLSENEYHYRP